MKNIFILSALLITFFYRLQAQQVYELDIQNSLDLAFKKSPDIQALNENLLMAEYQLKVIKNQHKTKISLDLSVPNYTENILEFEDSLGVYYYPVKKNIIQSYLFISQPLPTNGILYLTSGIYNIQDYYQKRQTIRLNTRLGLEQPIESFYSYNKLKTDIRQAELNYELAKKKLIRIKFEIKHNITKNFYYLVSNIEQEKIAQQTLLYQKSAYRLAHNKFTAGLIPEVEVLQMEVDLREATNNFNICRENRISQENVFKQLLGLNLNDSIIVHCKMDYKPIKIDLKKAIKLGLENRPEIRENEIKIEQHEINVKKAKLNKQITGSIKAYYDLIGVGENEFDIGAYNTYQNALNRMLNKQGDKGISVNISIPLWDSGITKANVEAAKSSLKISRYNLNNEKTTVEREIREVVNRLNGSINRLRLLEKNVSVAEKSYNLNIQRFSKGEINSQLLALDRNRLNQAYLSKLEAFIDYKLLLADLTKKTFYDFEKNRLLQLCP